MKLIVGLGNPGNNYQFTKHNVGFMVLDAYLDGVKWKSKFDGLYYEDIINNQKVIFLKPTTYMNLSGNCIEKFVSFFKIDVNDILIIQDDLDLPFLKYRLKYNSSSGGHNGIKSIISNLKTNAIPRLKIGIGNNKSVDTKDYVLSSFSKKEIEEFYNMSKVWGDIINTFISYGIDKCMQDFNS